MGPKLDSRVEISREFVLSMLSDISELRRGSEEHMKAVGDFVELLEREKAILSQHKPHVLVTLMALRQGLEESIVMELRRWVNYEPERKEKKKAR